MKYTMILTVSLIAAIQLVYGQTESVCPTTTPEENLKFSKEFYLNVLGEQNFDNIENYISDNYIQHNPWVPDGPKGLKNELAALLAAGTPKGSLKIIHSAANDDMVWFHSSIILQGEPTVLVDIFRVECGKLVEHWDVIQEMKPSTANPHPYF